MEKFFYIILQELKKFIIKKNPHNKNELLMEISGIEHNINKRIKRKNIKL